MATSVNVPASLPDGVLNWSKEESLLFVESNLADFDVPSDRHAFILERLGSLDLGGRILVSLTGSVLRRLGLSRVIGSLLVDMIAELRTLKGLTVTDPTRGQEASLILPSWEQSMPEDPIADANKSIRRELYEAPSMAPSSTAKPSNFKAWSAENPTFLCGRPPNATHAIPITLLHPVFAQFVQDCQDYSPTHEDNSFILQLSAGMANFYDDETSRATHFRSLMRKYGIDLAACTLEGRTYGTDGDARVNGFLYVVTEAKLDFGSAASDPYIQSALYHLESLRSTAGNRPKSRLPCLHIFYAGPCMGFSGSVFSNGLVANVLGPMLPLFWHPTDEQLRLQAARVFGAFKRAVLTLKQYYETITPNPLNNADPNDGDPRFPYSRSYRPLDNSSAIRTFRYQGPLLEKLPDRLIFLCLEESGRPVCVKFARRYSKEVHMFCANYGWAPQLYGFEELAGGWFMAVMEHLAKHRPLVWDDHPWHRDAIRQKAMDCVVQLHKAGYVHGDIRRSNLMVRSSGGELDVKVIDWDWAGKNGEARYPPNVTRELDGISRPEDASDGNLITAEHDLVMLNLLYRV